MANENNKIDYKEIIKILIPVLIAGLQATTIILSKMEENKQIDNKNSSKNKN